MNISMMKTRHGADVIRALMEKNPATVLPSGDIRLPPARLSFPNLARPGKNMSDPAQPGKYSVNLLFAEGADLSLLQAAREAALRDAFPNNPTGAGMRNPFRNQAEKVSPAEGGLNPKGTSLSGFVPGQPFIAPGSRNYRPHCYSLPIVNGVPTQVDEAQIESVFYPGCWVIAVVNAYASKNQVNPGVYFGLQSVLKIMDDESLGGGGGGAPNPAAFAGVNIDQGVNPASLF
ncbi:MAG: DUF2815 family protein [Cupriavidus sp.]|nr:DUF2815 family protein [Cupriavidus sp.]